MIEKLEAARREGGELFLVPGVGLWWLSDGSEFAEHLSRNPAVIRDESCVLYSLGFVPEKPPEALATPEFGLIPTTTSSR